MIAPEGTPAGESSRLKPAGGLDLHARGRRLIGEAAALRQLLHHLGRLGLQPARDLVGAPARLDLVLDLVERAFARRRDAEHVVPDIAAAIGDRVIVDADVAVEGLARPRRGPAECC